MKVNPNYRAINVEQQKNDPSSIYHFYKKMIDLRKKHQVLVYGEYELLWEDHPELYIYTRNMNDNSVMVICNFSMNHHQIDLSYWGKMELLLANYEDCPEVSLIDLRPYETRVYRY
ncbi:Oligo-1,6-glucosidase [Peribacillus simplex]|uniref:Oligo-1,6-glucosidase n=3 Tax=Peribacillus simplex TaxID=1478 RepID=A0A9W4L8S8_9BACI|nr:Oligo-1,6-glucosidase [Peribacillus simplex]